MDDHLVSLERSTASRTSSAGPPSSSFPLTAVPTASFTSRQQHGSHAMQQEGPPIDGPSWRVKGGYLNLNIASWVIAPSPARLSLIR